MSAALNLFCSFSGGETSGLLTRLCLTKWRNRWRKVVVGFANTSQENEETLEFVDRCDREFGFGVVWIEAVVNPEKGEGTGHQVVDFKTAKRNGEVFEEVIKKYGLPGPGRLHCTRELKANAIRSYLRSIGWGDTIYDVAIGIRADEKERKSTGPGEINPLIDWLPVTKADVNKYWMAQSFRLNLTGYQGNCKWCWKKSLRKHMTLLSEDPGKYDFPERMDALYGKVGHEFDEGKATYTQRVMFRGNLSTKDLLATYEANKATLEKAEDDAIVLPNGDLFPLDLEEGGCVEACEPTSLGVAA